MWFAFSAITVSGAVALNCAVSMSQSGETTT